MRERFNVNIRVDDSSKTAISEFIEKAKSKLYSTKRKKPEAPPRYLHDSNVEEPLQKKGAAEAP
jgi:hypothetical protein